MSRVSRALLVVMLLAPIAAAQAPAPAAIAPAPVTCADAGVLLARTFAAYDDAMIAKHEGEIAKACTAGNWSQAVLDCLGSTITETGKCIDQLPHDQQVALVSSVTRATPPAAPEPPQDGDDEKYTRCEDAVAAPLFDAIPGLPADDATFQVALQKHRLVDACNQDGWPEHAKECFAKATDSDHVMTCFKKLPDHAQTGVQTAVHGATDLFQMTFEARKTAAKITCPKVVAKHYADAAWKDKLTKIKPADKKAAMTSSRTKMTKVCTADKWGPTLRACVVSGGDYPECAMTSASDPWGYPAFGVIVPTGVPACDKYIAGIAKLAECPGAKDMRDALLEMVSSATSTMSEMSEDSRKVIAEACVQGMSALDEQSKQLGCKP